MDFREASDQLSALGVTPQEQAAALGYSYQTFRQMRMDASSTSSRTPPGPEKWRPAFRGLATNRARALDGFAKALK